MTSDLNNWIFRVGIKTLGRKSVDKVEVVITQRNGRVHAYSDAALRPAYSLLGDTALFSVKQDDIKFVEVCSWNKDAPEMRIHYHTSYQIILRWWDESNNKVADQMAPFILPVGIPIKESITLCVTGENANSVSKTLRINTSGETPQWEVVN